MKNYFKLFSVLIVFVFVIYSLFNKDHESEESTNVIEQSEPKFIYGILVDSLKVYNETVKDGQTLGQILYSNHIDHPQIAKVVNKSKDIFDVRTINSGNPYTLICDIDSAETLLYFIYELSDKITYVVFDFTKQPNVYEGKYDVLLATTIVENGLDIPNANTIFIYNAQNFGLSDLHQMRGRVGRSNKKAFCYFITPPLTSISDDSRKRIKAIEEYSELGSGIKIAMKDLEIRGAGNLLGAEQSGFINNIGFDW